MKNLLIPGHGVSANFDGSKLVLTFDLSTQARKLARVNLSGRNRHVAAVHGRYEVTMPDGAKLYLTAAVATKASPKGKGNAASSNPRDLRNGLTGAVPNDVIRNRIREAGGA